MTTPRGVLLDIDGTLLDSNDAHAGAWKDALAEHGIDASFAELRALIGMGGDKIVRRFGIEKESARGRQLAERRTAIFLQRYLPRVETFRGARALLERIAGAKIARVAATSARGDELEALLRRGGIDDLIVERATSSEAAGSKPDPDIVVAAIRRSGLPSDDLIMIGDTPYDVEASRAAGVRVIAFRCGGWTDGQLTGAMRVYYGPLDLLARWDWSPLAA